MLLVQNVILTQGIVFSIIAAIVLSCIGCVVWISLCCCASVQSSFRTKMRYISKGQQIGSIFVPMVIGATVVILSLLGLFALALTQINLLQSFSTLETKMTSQVNLSDNIITTVNSLGIQHISDQMGYTINFDDAVGKVVTVQSSWFSPMHIVTMTSWIFVIIAGIIILGFLLGGIVLVLSSMGCISTTAGLGMHCSRCSACCACGIIFLFCTVILISPYWCESGTTVVYYSIYGLLLGNECLTDVVMDDLLCYTGGDLTFYSPFYSLYIAIEEEIQINSNPSLPLLAANVMQLSNCTDVSDSFQWSYESICTAYPWMSVVLICLIFASIILLLFAQPFLYWTYSLWDVRKKQNPDATPLLHDTVQDFGSSSGRSLSVKMLLSVVSIGVIIVVILTISFICIVVFGKIYAFAPSTEMIVYTNVRDARIASLVWSDGKNITLYGPRDQDGIPIDVNRIVINSFGDDTDEIVTIMMDIDPATRLPIYVQDSLGGFTSFDWTSYEGFVRAEGQIAMGNGTSFNAKISHRYGSACKEVTIWDQLEILDDGESVAPASYVDFIVPSGRQRKKSDSSLKSRSISSEDIEVDILTVTFQVSIKSNCVSPVGEAAVKLWVCEGPQFTETELEPISCTNIYENVNGKFENGFYNFRVPASNQSIENYFSLNPAENICDAIHGFFCEIPDIFGTAKDVYDGFKDIFGKGVPWKDLFKIPKILKYIATSLPSSNLCGSNIYEAIPDFLERYIPDIILETIQDFLD